MTEEQKQALIEHIETDLELWRNITLKYCHECERDDVLRDIKVNEIALVALTAQPVKLPQRLSPCASGYGYSLVANDNGDAYGCSQIIEAIRAAGYEVNE